MSRLENQEVASLASCFSVDEEQSLKVLWGERCSGSQVPSTCFRQWVVSGNCCCWWSKFEGQAVLACFSSVALSAHFDTCHSLRDTMLQRSLLCQFNISSFAWQNKTEAVFKRSLPTPCFRLHTGEFLWSANLSISWQHVPNNLILPFRVTCDQWMI